MTQGKYFAAIRHRLASRRVVPFLGAGASLSATSALPTGRQLAKRLAGQLRLQSDEVDSSDLSEVASAAEVLVDRLWVEEQLSEIFSTACEPLRIHRFLATQFVGPLIITTNYDRLLETAFAEAQRDFCVAVPPVLDDFPQGSDDWISGSEDAAAFDRTCIVKLHGGFGAENKWTRAVISEDDYFEIGGLFYGGQFLPRRWAAVVASSSLLFLSHSLADPHVRFMVSRFQDSRLRLSAFLVNPHVSHIQALKFARMNLTVLQMTVDEFVDQLVLEE